MLEEEIIIVAWRLETVTDADARDRLFVTVDNDNS